MIWVVDKRVVTHLVESCNRLFELPVRVEFEYQCDGGQYVEGSLKTKPLFNEAQVLKTCPDISREELNASVEDSVRRDILEYIKMK
ncbi:MAG: hypothetical protein OXG25_09405 [Gammaproteobacteria bacterium]|nr:hypothetical protein [Gammaproteobacteria bacterium]